MSLGSDLLLAVSGVFPTEAITVEDARAAEGALITWANRLRRWVGQDDQEPFTLPKDRDPDKTLEKLARVMTSAETAVITADLTDVDLEADYLTSLLAARRYLVDAWPSAVIETAAGQRPLPLSQDELDEILSLVAVVDDPDRVIDEVEMLTLTPSQAEAFRLNYPALSATLLGVLRVALTDRGARNKEWEPPPEREDVIRTLAGLSPEAPIVIPDQISHDLPPLNLEKAISSTQTRAQRVEAPIG
jgi:hypothetical protein